MPHEEIKVHPAAAVFPMLSDDELADLAEDIKANGLLHPIVRDEDGQIIDGRNRHKACGIAGVEPTYTTLNGHDAVNLILSANIARRHLTKGQQAMVIARIRAQQNSIQTQEDLAGTISAARQHISQAQQILEWAPDLADGVISGAETFADALKIARDRKAAASSTEAQLRRLQALAPDLATRVVEEQMDLAEALGALRVRQQREAEAKRATSQLADTMLAFLDTGSAATIDERAEQIVATLDAATLSTRPDFSSGRFGHCAQVLGAIARQLREQEARRGDDPASGE